MSDVEREAKWAERDARKEAFEARMKVQAAQHRAEHIATVHDALVAADVLPTVSRRITLRRHAQIAVDALMESGVVFARMGSCDDTDMTEDEFDALCAAGTPAEIATERPAAGEATRASTATEPRECGR